MEKAIVLTVIKLTQASITGTDQLHEPVIFPETLTKEERQDVLFSDYDPQLRGSKIFQEVLKPAADFERGVKEEDVPRGVLSEYLVTAVRTFQENIGQRVSQIIDENLTRVDRALVSYASHYSSLAWSYFIRKKTEWLGRLGAEQADFLTLLKGQDRSGARLFAYLKTDLSLDRLRGYVVFQDTLPKAFAAPSERSHIQKVMDHLLIQHQDELQFWADRYVNMSAMNISLLHLVGAQYTNDYQQRTGCPKHIVELVIEERRYNQRYIELLASFYDDTCRRRKPGLPSRVVESCLNKIGDLYANEIGAKDARPFQELLSKTQTEFLEAYTSLKPYEEKPAFEGKSKAYEFTTAVLGNYWMLAKQIAINGAFINNTDVNWQAELGRLHDYQRLCNHLIFVQMELLKLKCLVDLMLTNQGNPELMDRYLELSNSEYRAQQNLTYIKLAYQKSVLGLLSRTAAYWEQLKTTFRDQVTRKLFTSNFFDQTPSFEALSRQIEDELGTQYLLIERTSSIVNPAQGVLAPKQVVKVKSASSSLTLTAKASKELPVTAKLSDSALLPLSPDAINMQALSIHKRFIDMDSYMDFVNNPTFLDLKTIEAGIAFCVRNHEEKKEGCNWIREKGDLEFLKKLMEGVQAYSASGKYVPPQQSSSGLVSLASSMILRRSASSTALPQQGQTRRSPEEIRQEILASFHKKLITDNSELQRNAAAQAGYRAQANVYVSLAYQSVLRKYERKNIYNNAPNFRDSTFRYNIQLELGLIQPEKFTAEELESSVNDFTHMQKFHAPASDTSEKEKIDPKIKGKEESTSSGYFSGWVGYMPNVSLRMPYWSYSSTASSNAATSKSDVADSTHSAPNSSPPEDRQVGRTDAKKSEKVD